MENPELKAINYLLETNKTLPPRDCSECHYNEFPNGCTILPEKDVERCRSNKYEFGMRSVYLKEKII
jgi:hypothetical protein